MIVEGFTRKVECPICGRECALAYLTGERAYLGACEKCGAQARLSFLPPAKTPTKGKVDCRWAARFKGGK